MAAVTSAAKEAALSIRGTTLRKAFSKHLEVWRQRVPADAVIADAFPGLHKDHGALLRALYERLWDNLTKAIESEFQDICAEREVYSKLAELDAFLERSAASAADPAKRPAPQPEAEVRNATVAAKLDYESMLRELLAQMRERNDALEAEVATFDAKAKALQQSIASKVAVIEQAAAACKTAGAEDA